MDLWGVGCVLFEVIALFPLFPGNDEMDQVLKIHNIVGSPPKELLDKFQKYATHMEFNFPTVTEGKGIPRKILCAGGHGGFVECARRQGCSGCECCGQFAGCDEAGY